MASKKGKKNLKKYDGIIGRRADGEAVTRPFRGRTRQSSNTTHISQNME